MAKPLTPKQKIFVAEYLKDLNATRAARAAGYSAKNADKIGPALLGNSRVKAAIGKRTEKRCKKLEITADKVLQELAKMGFANMQDYLVVNAQGQADVDLSRLTRDNFAAMQEIVVDATGGANDGERRLVLRTRFKLADKRGSLELLGKHLKLFPTKIEASGPNDEPIQVDQNVTVTLVRPK